MRKWRLSDEPVTEDTKEQWRDEAVRAKTKAKIFLGYTSNLISSGVRESLRYLVRVSSRCVSSCVRVRVWGLASRGKRSCVPPPLTRGALCLCCLSRSLVCDRSLRRQVEHRHVDVLVTSAGGVEEDLIKALARTYLGEFQLRGAELRAKGLNRIGNLLVPNENYCKFEDWIVPILNAMHDEQERHGVVWTPSKMIHRFGKEIDDESSVCYWCYKNNVPMFCPALTDGSIGDMLYFHSYRRPGLVCDIVGDIRLMNDHAIHAAPRRTGMIVLGGGVAKHHINNANLMRNGADFSVCVSTAQVRPAPLSPARRSRRRPPAADRGRAASSPACTHTRTRRAPLALCRSSTAPTRARAPTRRCRGARSGRRPRPSRCTPTPPSSSRSWSRARSRDARRRRGEDR